MRQRNGDLSAKIFHEQRGQVGDGLGLCRRQKEEGMDIQQGLGDFRERESDRLNST